MRSGKAAKSVRGGALVCGRTSSHSLRPPEVVTAPKPGRIRAS
jgi:hypothetical protein